MHWKESWKKHLWLNPSTITPFAWRNWEKSRSVSAEMRTEYPTSTSTELYLLYQPVLFHVFPFNRQSGLANSLSNTNLLPKLTYLDDMFANLNELNVILKGTDKTMIYSCKQTRFPSQRWSSDVHVPQGTMVILMVMLVSTEDKADDITSNIKQRVLHYLGYYSKNIVTVSPLMEQRSFNGRETHLLLTSRSLLLLCKRNNSALNCGVIGL
jgi:hypothetical protein